MLYGLKDEVISKIKIVLSNYKTIDSVILYGSRAKGNFKNSSDIDITIKGNIDVGTLNRLSNEIDELLLPYTFDISIFNHIANPDLLDHINRIGIVFYCK